MNGVTDDKPLSVPRDIDLRLDTSPITAVDALVLRYFLDYQWFVDFAVYSTAVYVFTEGYYCLADPQKETNIGVLWCLLTVVFSMYPSASFQAPTILDFSPFKTSGGGKIKFMDL
ncbi:hypothetical protein llap_21471 [Limosa lapponica baueri]|uniref:Transmembrane protein 161A n=1 Tax=Limosa lapponica baueri TaxID=1758121 RepID=A0A2I0T363_LIMLA|nr:hypothetical protein llap_21471 [Limosa lapponica baueri]